MALKECTGNRPRTSHGAVTSPRRRSRAQPLAASLVRHADSVADAARAASAANASQALRPVQVPLESCASAAVAAHSGASDEAADEATEAAEAPLTEPWPEAGPVVAHDAPKTSAGGGKGHGRATAAWRKSACARFRPCVECVDQVGV